MIRVILFLVLGLQLLGNALELTEKEKEYIAQNSNASVVLMPDFSPFSYIVDDRVVGFENDLLEAISQKTGLRFQKEFGVWNQNLLKFKSKEVDIIMSISHKKEREPFVNFTTPYYKIPIMIFIRDDFGKYSGIESLNGKRVGVLKDVFYIKELENLGGLELVIYETYEQITEALVFGKIDALIQNLPNINYLIKKNLYSNLVLADEFQMPGITKEDLRFGVNPDKPILHSILQKALDSISSVEMDALTDKWIDVKYNELKNIYAFSKEEQNFLDSRIVKYCIDPKFEPFEYIDKKGNHNGLTKDYLSQIIQKTGMKTELVKTKDWSETLQFLESRKCDIILSIGKTREREEFLLFTKPYLDFPQVVAMRNGADFVSSMNDLLDKRVGIIKDYMIGKLLEEKYENFYPIYVKDTEDGLEKVASGEIDGFINFLPTISNGISNIAIGNLKIAGKIDETTPLSAAVRNDEPVLYSILEKSLSMFESSEHKRILDKWMTIRFEHGTDYALVWRVVGAAIFLLLLFGYWNHKIQQAKKIIEKQNRELEALATTDKLTGVYNRLKLDEILQNEVERAKRYGHAFGCAIVDIDDFKAVNDTHGHLVGDNVLVEISRLVSLSIRKSDYFGRWGGEEFLIIAPEIDKDGFTFLLNKIQEVISHARMENVGVKTVSIGGAIFGSEETQDSVVKRADDALYEAKNSGKNRVVIHS